MPKEFASAVHKIQRIIDEKKIIVIGAVEITDNIFKGFNREAVDFLFGLQFENTSENKEINLQKYKQLIYEPLYCLYLDLKPAAAEIADFDMNPRRCLSSPYTDRRFTDKPIKEYCYLRFRQIAKSDIAGLYFDMGYEYYSYGLRIYKQTAQGMNGIREKILADTEKSSYIFEKISSLGYKIKGTGYKQNHYHEIKNEKLNSILNMKGFYITKEVPINENVFTVNLKKELETSFYDMREFSEIIL